MTKPRSQLISNNDTPYYHITSRCVRGAFLCGQDSLTQRNYDHRRQWIEDRIRLLSALFSIEIYAYAIMSNHLHLILKAIPDEVKNWTDREVIRRWLSLFRGPLVIHQHLNGEQTSNAENETISALIELWRSRLTDISWFMKCLREPIARQANREDQCKGHFWEAKSRSHTLLDEEALTTVMTDVELNPVRTAFAKTPADS